ncbi:GntR family transcriptional regulator [Cohnella caldifontis]|uniref:GntR family transcriptional regulator n=1 Tax=Cohnella caldifontis TaxID=3027471 RepID=UPI0023ED3731|nr:GntR family transcriptional regulator [Cohnella sp. YIM B05605]
MKPFVSKSNLIPMYHQIANHIREHIVEGVLQPETQIPTEEEIVRDYGVSRMTARQAVTQLVQEGLVYRIHGKGAFVARKKLERSLNRLNGFHQDMVGLGLSTSSKVIGFKRRKPDQKEQHVLGLNRSHYVFEVRRIRYVNDRPMGVQSFVVAVHLVPELEKQDLENGSFYAYLQSIGRALVRAEQRMEAVLSPDSAKLLGVSESLPFFYFERISYDKDDQPIELLHSYFRGDQYSYGIQLGE